MVGYYHSSVLPWTSIPEEQRRFKKIVQTIVIVFLVAGLAIPFISVPERDRAEAEVIPPRLAKLILEKQKPKPKPPVKIAEKKKEEPKPKKEEPKEKPKKKKTEKKPEPKPKPEVKKEPPKKQVDVAKAREKASKSGLLALADELADLRDEPVVSDLSKKIAVKSGSKENAPKADPSLLTSNVKGSGGIDTASLSQATRTRSLETRNVEAVESPVEETAKTAFEGASNEALNSPRTLEEIQLVFDKYKGAITRMYNRELRKDPTLQGVVVLEITIAPTGEVVDCKVVSSDIQSPKLLNKLIARVKTFRFQAKDVAEMTIKYPVDFSPLS